MEQPQSILYKTSVPIIFNGLHTMLYGNPAFGMGIEAICSIKLEVTNKKNPEELKEIDQLIKKYIKKKKQIVKEVSYTYTLRSPDFYSILDSPSLIALFIASIGELYSGTPLLIAEINALTFRYSKGKKIDIFGLNSSISTIGGLIYYRKEFEFLKGIYQLPFHIPSTFCEHIYILFFPTSKNVVNIPFKKLSTSLEIFQKITKRLIISIVKEDIHYFKQQLVEQNTLLTSINAFSSKGIQIDKDLKKNEKGFVIDEYMDSTTHYSILWIDDIKNINSIPKTKGTDIVPLKQHYKGLERMTIEEWEV